ncbi:immunoglobulin v-set domain-containing protein [Phthorimaea operculella]|nr:immunoglobulin v-set domain-containing protein [Phthorimaea operculella]
MRWRVAGGMGGPLAAAVFCMLPLFTSSTGDIRHHGTSRSRGWRAGVQPNADVTANNSVSNVTAQLGGTAYLHCLVGHLSERGQVSWIRKRDWHILSSGKFTYTNDERFQVLHGEGSEDWTLQIKFVQKRDNGTYECQYGGRIRILAKIIGFGYRPKLIQVFGQKWLALDFLGVRRYSLPSRASDASSRPPDRPVVHPALMVSDAPTYSPGHPRQSCFTGCLTLLPPFPEGGA